MTYNFLYLVNRLCHKLNETELSSANFSGAIGVYQDFMESVNAAIRDIYQEEDGVWPFARTPTTFNTIIGTNTYTANANAAVINWWSFYIKKQPQTPDSITSSGTTATVTVSAGHPHQTGDTVFIKGANQANYNGNQTVTVLSSTQFTYAVPSGTVSPATGTILIYPQYTTARLTPIGYDAYLDNKYIETDGECIQVGQYGKPSLIVRDQSNNFIVTAVPDRIYTITYDYYTAPTDLVAYNDIPVIPEHYKQVIVDGAMYHAYLFRDNIEEAGEAKNKYTDGVNRMRRALIPQDDFMRIDASLGY